MSRRRQFDQMMVDVESTHPDPSEEVYEQFGLGGLPDAVGPVNDDVDAEGLLFNWAPKRFGGAMSGIEHSGGLATAGPFLLEVRLSRVCLQPPREQFPSLTPPSHERSLFEWFHRIVERILRTRRRGPA